MAKSIPRNLSAGLFPRFGSHSRTKDLQNISRMAHGSQLRISASSLTESAGGVLSLWQPSSEASDGYPAKGYSRLLHWSYTNFLYASLIYNVEIRRMVPGRTSGTHFPDAAAHSPGQGSLPPSARDIPSYIRPVCSGASFFLLVIADLVCEHLVIDKAATADCFLYLDFLLFIWIDPYFYGAVHSSHLLYFITITR